MPVRSIVRAEQMQTLPFSSIGASYTKIGTNFNHQMRMVKFVNLTDATLIFSFDGIVDHDIIPAGGFSLYDFCTNQELNGGFFVSVGTAIYVKESGTPTSGAVYVCSFFGAGD